MYKRLPSSSSTTPVPFGFELDDFQGAVKSQRSEDAALEDATLESDPLIAHRSDPTFRERLSSSGVPLQKASSSRRSFRGGSPLNQSTRPWTATRASTIMEKLKESKVAWALDKIAVDAEPGLTNAQLFLTNHDLKPGQYSILSLMFYEMLIEAIVEPERRQWGPWNFVGFWIADSFNIVCTIPIGSVN